ncbi:MAG: hypothetical protein WEA24_08520 [Gemmatimonadota bacterium]
MRAHKSAFLGLALGALALGVTACEDKDSDITLPPPAVEISISPAGPINLQVNETATVNANVTGGDASTDRTVIYSSSNPSVASVSGNVITAAGPGTATITATNAANSLTASVQVVVTQPTTPPPAPTDPPTISIQSITTGNTLTPVNINNVFGQIDITLNVDNVPQQGKLLVTLTNEDGTTVVESCEQNFTGGTGGIRAAEANAAVEIVCSINTAQFDPATGTPVFLNGTWTVSAQLENADGEVKASTSTDLVFNNTDHFVLEYSTPTGPEFNSVAGILPAGSAWRAGAVTVNLIPVIFTGAGSVVQTANVTMTSSAVGTAGCTASFAGAGDPTVGVRTSTTTTTPNCTSVTVTQQATAGSNGILTATFPNTTATNGVGSQEDVWAFSVSGAVNASGQTGPTCVNPHPTRNPIVGGGCFGADTFFGFGTLGHTNRLFANPLALDNLAPRVVSFNMIAPGGNQYFNDDIAFSAVHNSTVTTGSNANVGRVVTIDWGVDDQTAETTTFLAGPSGSLTAVDGPGDLDESPTNAAYTAAVEVEDELGNSRTLYAHNTTATTVRTSASAPSVRFGVDNTAPTAQTGFTSIVTPEGNLINYTPQSFWSFNYIDTGVGPSGFGTNPVLVSLRRVLPGGTTCVIGGSGCSRTALPIGQGGTMAYDATNANNLNTSSGIEGYYRLNATVVDAAGNETAVDTELALHDLTEPVVAPIGGPSSINGGTDVNFTSSMEDNVELGTIEPFVGFVGTAAAGAPTFTPYIAGTHVVVGTMGEDDIDDTSAGNATFNDFIVTIEGTDGNGRPTAQVAAANTINYNVRDVAAVELNQACPVPGAATPLSATQNCTQRADNIFTNVQAGTPGSTTAFGASFGTAGFGPTGFAAPAQASHGNFVLNAPSLATDVDVDKDATTLTATATGPNATFADPFPVIEFWYQDSQALWHRVPGAVVRTATDDTQLGTRTWSYTLKWAPTSEQFSADDAAVHIVAVAILPNGRALATDGTMQVIAIDT